MYQTVESEGYPQRYQKIDLSLEKMTTDLLGTLLGQCIGLPSPLETLGTTLFLRPYKRPEAPGEGGPSSRTEAGSQKITRHIVGYWFVPPRRNSDADRKLDESDNNIPCAEVARGEDLLVYHILMRAGTSSQNVDSC